MPAATRPTHWGTVTCNGTAMTLAVGSAGTGSSAWGCIGIYYLDDPAAVGIGNIVVQDPGYSLAVSAVVLSGTVPGVGNVASSNTQDFVNLNVSAGSVVVAGSSDGSSGSNAAVAPLIEIGSVNFVQSAPIGNVVTVTATIAGTIIPDQLFVSVAMTSSHGSTARARKRSAGTAGRIPLSHGLAGVGCAKYAYLFGLASSRLKW